LGEAGSVLDGVASAQDGVVTRAQALGMGFTPAAIRHHLRAGRWQRLARGAYATFSGPVPRGAHLWGAVLAAGAGAVLSHETAAELWGLLDEPAPLVHVTVPASRRILAPPGTRLHISTRMASARHPSRLPPRTRVEATVLDLTQSAPDVASAVGWVVSACARRLTTPDRLRAAVAARPKLRWRPALLAALDDSAAGCHSMLEVAYRNRVERTHGLPTAARQVARARRGGRWYDDVHYPDHSTLVELDGAVAHRPEAAARDHRRDNAGTAAGLSVLRYGVGDVLARPCEVAAEVATVLARNGWRGRTRPCGPDCVITKVWCSYSDTQPS
jgi:very-short-patch-repair endonuclease